MILASFDYNLTVTTAGQETGLFHTVDLDFSALYQLNPRHLIVLKYASITALRKDAVNATLTGWGATMARLIGPFNETRNIVAATTGAITNQSVVSFDGIAFNGFAPFVAPVGARILMPPSFQIQFRQGMQVQTALGDNIRVWFTIGYELELKETRF